MSWRQLSGRLQFLSSLSGSTTGMQSSSSTSVGTWRAPDTNATTFILRPQLFSVLLFLWSGFYLSHTHTPTFIILNTLQLHDFLLHFLLSTGFIELSRMWPVDAELGKSGLYSVSETHARVLFLFMRIQKMINLYCGFKTRCIPTIVMLNGSIRQKGNFVIRGVGRVIHLCKNKSQIVLETLLLFHVCTYWGFSPWAGRMSWTLEFIRRFWRL